MDLNQIAAIEKAKAEMERARFNELKPYQRFVKSILGDLTETAENALLKLALRFVFGEPTILKKEGPL